MSIDPRQDRHRGKAAICTAGTVGILTDLFSLLSMYNCPATNITVANTITNIALANCETLLILLHQISLIHRHSRMRTLDPRIEFRCLAGALGKRGRPTGATSQ